MSDQIRLWSDTGPKTTTAREGFSRRDVLKIGAATAVAVSTEAAGLRLTAQQAEAAQAGNPSRSNEFAVDIPGAPVASRNCVAVKIEPLSVDAIDVTPPGSVDKVFEPGDLHLGDAKFVCNAVQGSHELQDWFDSASVPGAVVRKNITVNILGRDGSAARTISLQDCSIMSWDAGEYTEDTTIVTETVIVKVGSLTIG